MSVRRAWQQFQVVLTGAFLTGEPLQVRVSDYLDVQRALGEALSSRPGEGWGYAPLRWQDIAGSYDVRGGYPSLVPLVLLERDGEELRTLVLERQAGRPAQERAWLAARTAGWSWTLRSLNVQLFDFGVGVAAGIYDVEAPALLGVRETRRVVEDVSRLKPDERTGVRSPIAAAYEQIAKETVDAFHDAVVQHAPGARQEPWLTPLQTALRRPPSNGEAADPTREVAESDWGRLLWLHPVYVLSAPARARPGRLSRIARPFQGTFIRTVGLADGMFVPGIDSSLIVVRGAVERRRDDLMRLIVLQWAYYALFMEIDRGLLATLDNDKWESSGTLTALEEDAERMFAIYMRVQETKSRLNSVLADLGGGALTLWDAIADAQRFNALVDAVDGKVDNLQRVSERRVQEAAADRARRTGNILGGLAALTVVTVVIGLFGSLVGSRADEVGHVALRAGTIVAAFLVALFLYMRQREIVRRRHAARRSRRALRTIRRRPRATSLPSGTSAAARPDGP